MIGQDMWKMKLWIPILGKPLHFIVSQPPHLQTKQYPSLSFGATFWEVQNTSVLYMVLNLDQDGYEVFSD